jgi:pilus assembly protein Flp/PilA
MSIVDRGWCHLLQSRTRNGEQGQGLAEYALILALIAIVCVAALQLMAGGVGNALNSVTSSL